MRIRFELLRRSETLRDALRGDGWQWGPGEARTLVASHPDAPNEAAARGRLFHLGLLTSSLLRIDFGPGDGPADQ